MPDALVTRVELGRLPFERRPIAEPGTRLVLQLTPTGNWCVRTTRTRPARAPRLRGPKAACVVEHRHARRELRDGAAVRSSRGLLHRDDQLPVAGPRTRRASSATVATDPRRREHEAHLEHWLPTITSAFPPDQTLPGDPRRPGPDGSRTDRPRTWHPNRQPACRAADGRRPGGAGARSCEIGRLAPRDRSTRRPRPR